MNNQDIFETINKERFYNVNNRLIAGEIINYNEMLKNEDKLRSSDTEDTDYIFILQNIDFFKLSANILNKTIYFKEGCFYCYIENDTTQRDGPAKRLKSEFYVMLLLLSNYASNYDKGCSFTDSLSPIGIKKKKFFDFIKREKGNELFFKIAKESTPEKAYEKLINQGYLFEKEDMIFLTSISSFIYETELKDYLENKKII